VREEAVFGRLSALTGKRLLRFGLVGGSSAVIYFLLLYLGVDLLQIDATLASSITYLVVIAYNYLMHYSWTYKATAPHASALRRFVLMNLVGFCLNAAIMFGGVTLLGLNYLLIQTLAIGVVVAWNYCMYSLWVFRG
jgi:putative flippase GtrA